MGIVRERAKAIGGARGRGSQEQYREEAQQGTEYYVQATMLSVDFCKLLATSTDFRLA